MVAVTDNVAPSRSVALLEPGVVMVTTTGAGLTVTVRVAVFVGSVLEATVAVAVHCAASRSGGV
jgi:hypothetical protein